MDDRGGLAQRQSEMKNGPVADARAFNPNLSSMPLENLLGDGKPQPHAASRRVAFGRLVKALKEALRFGGVDAFARVVYLHLHALLAVQRRPDFDAAAPARVAGG